MRNAEIISSGSYAPDNVLTNQYFNDQLGVNVSDWLEEVLQIHERRWIKEDQTTSDLAVAAAQQCLEKGGISVEEVDLIIVSTDTPDYISPSTAAIVQHKMGCTNAGTFDINAACAGFVTALDMGAKYIRTDEHYKYILVIGAYAMSRFLDKSDKKTVTLFADGAGAILLGASELTNQGYQAGELRSMGQYHSWMGIYGGGAAQPFQSGINDIKPFSLRFIKKFPAEINAETWSDMAKTLNKRLEVGSSEVNQYFITQLNINSIWQTMDILNVPREQAYTVMHRYGYTGSACIPMAFNEAMEKGVVSKGDLVYFIGSGGGLAFASAAFIL